MNKTTLLIIIFLSGVALGIAGTLFLPGYLRPYLPESIVGKETTVQGTVVAKQKKGSSLLLTVNTPQGALLSTMNKKVDEINLLVSVDDEIEFTLEEYKPFIHDPRITRVIKDTGRKETAAVPEQTGKPSVEKTAVKPVPPTEKKSDTRGNTVERPKKEEKTPDIFPPVNKIEPQEKKNTL